MAKIEAIKHRVKGNIYPITKVEAISNNTGETLQSILDKKLEESAIGNAKLTITNGNNIIEFTANSSEDKSIEIVTLELELSDWLQNDNTKKDYIKNKPNVVIINDTINREAVLDITFTNITSWNNKVDKDDAYTALTSTVANNATAVASLQANKLDKNQGVANKDKTLIVDALGDLVVSDFPKIDIISDTETSTSKTWSSSKIDSLKVDKVEGKGLSTNDYTSTEKTKLAGIESGALKNVKPDWNAAAETVAEILNKPTIPTVKDSTITIQKDSTDVGSFTLNGDGKTINITVANDINNAVSNHNTNTEAHSDIRTSISTIESKISTEATAENKLVSKSEAVDIIRLNAADYIGSNDTLSLSFDYLTIWGVAPILEVGPWFKGTPDGVKQCFVDEGVKVELNDYAIVTHDETKLYFIAHDFKYERVKDGESFVKIRIPGGAFAELNSLSEETPYTYKFTDNSRALVDNIIDYVIDLAAIISPSNSVAEYIGGYNPNVGPDNTYSLSLPTTRYICTNVLNNIPLWSLQYIVSDVSMTDELLLALNSGINATKVNNYLNHILNLNIHVSATDKENWNAKLDSSAISDMATKTWVGNQNYLTEHQSLDGYATEQWVTNKNYLTLESDPTVPSHVKAITQDDINKWNAGEAQVQSDWNITDETNKAFIKNKPSIPTNVSDLADAALYAKKDDIPTKVSAFENDKNYLTTETEPAFTASAASGITTENITSWNNKADKSESLAGYGITDAYTKTEVDNELSKKLDNLSGESSVYGSINIVNDKVSISNAPLSFATVGSSSVKMNSNTLADDLNSAVALGGNNAVNASFGFTVGNGNTISNGYGSAIGYSNNVSSFVGSAFGHNLTVSGATSSSAFGHYNEVVDTAVRITGYGTEDEPKNIEVLTTNGEYWTSSDIMCGGTYNSTTKTPEHKLSEKINDAPSDNKLYARKNAAWVEVTGGGGGLTETLIPAVMYQGTVPTEGDLPGAPAVTNTISGDGSLIKYSIAPIFSDSTHVTGLVLKITPGNDVTQEAWFRNGENWNRAGSTNIHIGDVTLADTGYTLKYYKTDGSEAMTYGRGVTKVIITLGTPVEVSTTTIIHTDCTTWGALVNDTARNNEYTLTGYDYPLSTLTPLYKGTCYKAEDTQLYWVYDGSEWESHPVVGDTTFISIPDAKVGGSGTLASKTIRDAIETNYGYAIGDDTLYIQGTTPPYLASSEYHNYIFTPSDSVTTGTLLFSPSIECGKYTLYSGIYSAGGNVYVVRLTPTSTDTTALPSTIIAGENASTSTSAGTKSAIATVFVVPDDTTDSGKRMLVHYMRY